MKQRDEKELLQLVRRSDYSAFEELHARFWKPLYVHAVKKTGSREDAFDLVQDLFMDLWDKRARIPEIDAPLKYYLRSAIIFKIATYFRTKGFQEKHEKNYEEFLKQEAAVTADVPFQPEDGNPGFDVMLDMVNSAIEAMPEKMQRIFLMSRSGNYSIPEIAASLHLSPQTVKNQISTALQRLRKMAAGAFVTMIPFSFLWGTIIS